MSARSRDEKFTAGESTACEEVPAVRTELVPCADACGVALTSMTQDYRAPHLQHVTCEASVELAWWLADQFLKKEYCIYLSNITCESVQLVQAK